MAHDKDHPAKPEPRTPEPRPIDPPKKTSVWPEAGQAMHVSAPGETPVPVPASELARQTPTPDLSINPPPTPSHPNPPVDVPPGHVTRSGSAPADKSSDSTWNPAGAKKYGVGDKGMYMRADGSSVHAIPATVAEMGIDPSTGLQGVRLSVSASPGRAAFDVWASHSEGKESGTWHRV